MPGSRPHMRHAQPLTGRRPRRVVLRVVVALLGVAGVLAGGSLLWANWALSRVPTFGAGPPQPGPGAGAGVGEQPSAVRLPEAYHGVTTFLIFSTGSQGMTEEEARRYQVPDLQARQGDGLTDTIMLAVLDADQRELNLLSIPRDTWLEWRGRRINETFRREGAAEFASDVTRLTGLPINHMVAVSFTAAGRLVDTVGGIDVRIPAPMRDAQSHLMIPQAGCVHMDGSLALAFARSRHTEIRTDEGWRPDPSADDFGRQVRQQAIVVAALDKLLSPRLPTLLPGLAATARETLIVDAGLDLGEVTNVARVLADGQPLRVHHYGLPARPATMWGASVLVPDPGPAASVLQQVQATVPGAHWPDWLPPPDEMSGDEESPLGASQDPGVGAHEDTTSVLGDDAPVRVRGYDVGETASYAPCS